MNNLTNKLKLQKGQSGFTIIEVLIVLAIAALIILAVLLAVPALQNNQKDNARKQEASRVATGIATMLSDNNNKTLTAGSASASGSTDAGQLFARANIGGGQFKTVTIQAAGTAPANNTTVYVRIGYICDGNNPSKVTTGGYAVYYSTQTNATNYGACITAQQ